MMKIRISVLIIVFLISCADEIKMTEQDVNKYKWLLPITSGIHGDFSYGTHNVDNGKMVIVYKNVHSSSVIDSIKTIAIKSGWQIRNYNDSLVILSKLINEVPVQMDSTVLTVRYENSSKSINIVLK